VGVWVSWCTCDCRGKGWLRPCMHTRLASPGG
jgi:hypothetical protein